MKIEIRNNVATIEGYVNAVERESRILPKKMASEATGDFVEKVKSKTFQRAIEKANDIAVMFNHQKVLGTTQQGSLELYEDDIGLHARAMIVDEEVIASAKAGKLKGWSFGFSTIKDSWETMSNGMRCRTLEDITLSEVSILTMTPAYIATSIEMRGEDCVTIELRGTEEDIEVIENMASEIIAEKDDGPKEADVVKEDTTVGVGDTEIVIEETSVEKAEVIEEIIEKEDDKRIIVDYTVQDLELFILQNKNN